MQQTTPSTMAEVALADITPSETNKVFNRDASDFTVDALQELINSITEQGLAQPILVRPDPAKKGKFVLVAGERRFHACKFIQVAHKERITIPAYIREMTEDQAFDLQLTENIQRKDVHPMREAQAYKFLQEKKGWSTAELAKRFGKGETYVLQRLRLNTLIPEAAKDFASNAMTLSHALVLARLEPADQALVIKERSRKHDGKKYYDSVAELEDFIQDEIVMDLKQAPFDINDETIVTKAGSCLKCPKRSGANALLFPDIKEKDRCFDGACYKLKKSIALFAMVKDVMEKEPDIVILQVDSRWEENKVPQQIASFLASDKIKPLVQYQDWSEHTYGGSPYTKKITGLMINGDKAGRKVTAYIKGGKSAKASATGGSNGKTSAAEVRDSIARIRERTKRAAELDDEKIYDKVIEALVKSKDWREGHVVRAEDPERGLLANLLYNHADFTTKNLLNRKLGLPTGFTAGAKRASVFKSLSEKDIYWMVRQIATAQYTAPNMERSSEGLLIKDACIKYGVPLEDLKAEQAAIRKKREARAQDRIADLQSSLKPKKAKGKKK